MDSVPSWDEFNDEDNHLNGQDYQLDGDKDEEPSVPSAPIQYGPAPPKDWPGSLNLQ